MIEQIAFIFGVYAGVLGALIAFILLKILRLIWCLKFN